ncbi:fungal-specific transcription factor domain-containing protein [Xylariales sp. PMI_506]|nr:fungal-specific transcription factor domain-containing protein [Xylariales sp. PMI_506]
MSLSPPETASDSAPSISRSHQKRNRLSIACNQCRKRKVRCDTTLPKCRNCVLRNENCETTDLRHHGKGPGQATRTWATHDSLIPARRDSTERRYIPNIEADESHEDSSEPSRHSRKRQASVELEGEESEGPLTWLSRAYQANVVDGNNHPESLEGSTPDVVVNTDDTAYRVKFVGGSSIQCLCTFVDLHLTSKGLPPISTGFKHGMQHSEEFSLPLLPSFPRLPPREELDACKEAFFKRIWPLFPVVDQQIVETDISRILRLEQTHGDSFVAQLSPTSLPALAVVYAMICIGEHDIHGRNTELSSQYLHGAYSLYGHLVAIPYTTSIQALILLALALRGCMKDGQAWQVLGQAIRVAHSVGLHKAITSASLSQKRPQQQDSELIAPPSGQTDLGLRARIWWSCYALERLMQLESGRPAIVSDKDIDQVPPDPVRSPELGYFAAWVALSKIMGRISNEFYSRRPANAIDLFKTVQTLDQALVDWKQSLPEDLGLKYNTTSGDERGDSYRHHIASFISLQFYSTHITLLRISLIFPHNSYTAELKKHATTLPGYPRLQGGAEICLAMARASITEMLQLTDHGERSIVLGLTPIYLSAIVLALGILRQPTRLLARADLELFNIITELVDKHCSTWLPNSINSISSASLRERVNTFYNRFGSRGLAALDKPHTWPQLPTETQVPTSPGSPSTNLVVGGVLETSLGQFDFGHLTDLTSDSLESFGFDELWNMMGPDLHSEYL